MVEEIYKAEVVCIVEYAGHNVLPSGSIDINLKASYSEMTNYLQLYQMLNNDVNISAKVENLSKPIKIGQFRIKQIKTDHDGSATLKFNSITDFVDINNVNELVGQKGFKTRFTAEIQLENDSDGED